MEELIRTNDWVTLSAAEALLAGIGVECLIADHHMSVLDGSIGLLPRRLLVIREAAPRARRLLIDAGLGGELRPAPSP